MSLDATALLRILLSGDRREEVLGDLLELRGRRAPWRLWIDVASLGVRAPRLRRAVAVLLVVIGTASLRSGNPQHRTIRATDAAGWFTLEFEGTRVIGASLDGIPVPDDRLVLADGRVVIRGGTSRGTGDLNIRLRPDGSFYWQGRSPRTTSTP